MNYVVPIRHINDEPIVITGIGLIASVGLDRESVWRAVQQGKSGVGFIRGLRNIEDDTVLGAMVDIKDPIPLRHKAITMAERAATEALDDARIDFQKINLDRFACSTNGHMGDWRWLYEHFGFGMEEEPGAAPWWTQLLPNSTCVALADKFKLGGPRICHSTACASGLISFLTAVRSIRDGQCDIALVGCSDAIDPLMVAGFTKMRVLAKHQDPEQACRPFDRNRSGFVLGEGSAVFVVERLSHALKRNVKIYAEVTAGKMLAEAHHVTGLDAESETLSHLIHLTLQQAGIRPEEVGYINAHGTGTQLNDLVEMRGIRRALGRTIDNTCVSATKSMLGHMINAAGGAELAITALAMRDGFAPPTINLTDPDPECKFDCLPLVGRTNRFQNALKISIAFGGHLVAVALRRWGDPATGYLYPEEQRRVA